MRTPPAARPAAHPGGRVAGHAATSSGASGIRYEIRARPSVSNTTRRAGQQAFPPHPQSLHTVVPCPNCYVELPATGTCDACGYSTPVTECDHHERLPDSATTLPIPYLAGHVAGGR